MPGKRQRKLSKPQKAAVLPNLPEAEADSEPEVSVKKIKLADGKREENSDVEHQELDKMAAPKGENKNESAENVEVDANEDNAEKEKEENDELEEIEEMEVDLEKEAAERERADETARKVDELMNVLMKELAEAKAEQDMEEEEMKMRSGDNKKVKDGEKGKEKKDLNENADDKASGSAVGKDGNKMEEKAEKAAEDVEGKDGKKIGEQAEKAAGSAEGKNGNEIEEKAEKAAGSAEGNVANNIEEQAEKPSGSAEGRDGNEIKEASEESAERRLENAMANEARRAWEAADSDEDEEEVEETAQGPIEPYSLDKHVDKCKTSGICDCYQLEAAPILTNTDLWEFNVRSKDVQWSDFVMVLDETVRGDAVELGTQVDVFDSMQRNIVPEGNRRKLLVCHDMMGNYLADRHFNKSKKYDSYRFTHWAGVDYFCYFSHNYVTIPPSTWLNAAHRHGVPVLGTFIVENTTLMEEFLASRHTVHTTVLALLRLCHHFGFEGWLLNIEVAVPFNKMPHLSYFVSSLTSLVGAQVNHGRVIWYDSVTKNGTLKWQNELNNLNAEFFRASHGTLFNYAWEEDHLVRSVEKAALEGSPLPRLFMGVDVFGRSRKGGMLSLESLQMVAAKGCSAAVFAPGWTLETMTKYGYKIHKSLGDPTVNTAFSVRNEAFWGRMWQTMFTHPYTSLPFFTDFCVGAGRNTYALGGVVNPGGGAFYNLARQSLQPSVPLDRNAVHHFEDAFCGGNSLAVQSFGRPWRLFISDFMIRNTLVLGYAYKEGPESTLDVVLRVSSTLHRGINDLYLFCGDRDDVLMTVRRCYLRPLEEEALPTTMQHPLLPREPSRLNGDWNVRYYAIRFDGSVTLRDIGVECRRPYDSTDEVYLGALYVSTIADFEFENLSSATKAQIPVYTKRWWSHQGL